jgi:iron(III) transport system substrate-binding protein
VVPAFSHRSKGCGGGEERAGARKLVDYLLSTEVEAKLAASASHQIPLNPRVKAKLPAGMVTPGDVKAMQIHWERAADRWEEPQRFLADEFGK